MINDPAYPKPNHCDNCGDVLDVYYGEWYREECYCETCGLPLCRDCYDEHLWDDHMVPEVRREFERLQVENSDLLRKSKRAVELLRLAKKEIIEMSNAIWDEYEGVDEMERIDNELARELEAFLHELEGSDG